MVRSWQAGESGLMVWVLTHPEQQDGAVVRVQTVSQAQAGCWLREWTQEQTAGGVSVVTARGRG